MYSRELLQHDVTASPIILSMRTEVFESVDSVTKKSSIAEIGFFTSHDLKSISCAPLYVF